MIKKCITYTRGKASTIGILKIALMLMIINNSAILLFYSPANALFYKENDRPLPVLLIHGFLSDASVWNKWKDFLKKDGIQSQAVTFKQSDDKCAAATDHAKELYKIVQDFKKQTGAQKINIVGYSKGGLDARLYLSNRSINDIANLIMIGTPNAGSPLANGMDICSPAIKDLRTKSAATTNVTRNPNTNYYIIAGDWNPIQYLQNCLNPEWPSWLPSEITGYFLLQVREGNNDGIVPVSSVESQNYFINLGHTSDCHSSLLGDTEYYGKARNILIR